MRIIVIISIAICFLIINCSAFALSIIKPQKGDTYFVGQTLTVELQPLPDESVEQIILSTKHFSGAAFKNVPFRYVVKLDEPVDGEEPIGVVGELKNGKTILLTTYIYVKLPNELKIKDVILEDELAIAYMSPSGNSDDKIRANGLFSDGKSYPLNFYSQTKYSSLNESIAKVDSAGVITGVSPGKTKIIITAGSVTKEIEAKVIYKIDPVKGISVVGQKKSNVIKWEKSPYEGDAVTGYNIYKCENKYGMGKKLVATVPIGVTSYVDDKFEAGTDYYYSIFYSVQAFSQRYNTGSSMKHLWISPKYKY